MSHDSHIQIDNGGSSKPSVFVRVAVIIGMLVILFLIAIAIVRYVPKFISSFGQANVSLTSLFNSNNATTTPETNNVNTGQTNNQNENQNTSATNSQNTNNQTTNRQSTTNQNNRQSTSYSSYPTYNTYPSSRNSTPADLSISLVKVGRLLPNGALEQTTNFNAGDRISVQFTVANIGGSSSSGWTLSANLPTTVSYEQNYTSGSQPSIQSGASYLMTLSFDSYDPNQRTITIRINASDSNSSNNTLTINVSGTYTNTNTNTNNNCYWTGSGYYCSNYNNYNYNYNYGSNCYWSNNQYICNNSNSNNNCYWSNGQYYCNNYNSNNCYWSNNQYICNNSADLQVRIISTGIVNRSTGQYTATSNITRNDKAAVQIEVRNIGNTDSGQWSFTSTLSGSGGSSTYSSGTTGSIQPGNSQLFVATFDNPNPGQQNVSVQATLSNNASENNTSNNYASQGLYINY